MREPDNTVLLALCCITSHQRVVSLVDHYGPEVRVVTHRARVLVLWVAGAALNLLLAFCIFITAKQKGWLPPTKVITRKVAGQEETYGIQEGRKECCKWDSKHRSRGMMWVTHPFVSMSCFLRPKGSKQHTTVMEYLALPLVSMCRVTENLKHLLPVIFKSPCPNSFTLMCSENQQL